MMTSRRTNRSMCFILVLVMSLHVMMTCISAHTNIPAFVSQNSPLMHKPGRLKFVDDEEVVSPTNETPTKSVDVDDDKANIRRGIIEDHSFDEDDTVEEKTDWLSATRTLGSLFLRQEDEDRDKNVDVFGRALVGNDTEVEGGLLHENSIANYLMNLKKQEEDNRERSAEHRQSKKLKDASGGGIFQQNLSPEDVS